MSQATAQPEPGKKYRLVTRSDMDGLVCGVLLKALGLIEEITFAHPKDMQDGIIDIGSDDITTNLPYVEGVGMCFDHHASETVRLKDQALPENYIINPDAPSAARVVYEHFGGAEKFTEISLDMMSAVDKADAAQFSKDEILDPQGWELLSFIMDARTGLGRFREFNISNYQLMMQLIDYCLETHSIDALLELPDVKERVDLYKEHQDKFKEQLERCTTLHKESRNLAVIDLRQEDTIWAGNRFVVYALFPTSNISMHIIWGKDKQNTVFAVGKSILNRTHQGNVGEIMLEYGGGGHHAAGTCQVENLKAEEVKNELIDRLSE
jgi:nanoRNase/pAp phosphatase (c-di-AMP/oligoRNAs hydrolase)